MSSKPQIRFILAALAALLLATGLVAGCGDDGDSDSEGSLSGVSEANERYEGLTQNGTQLGDPNAKEGVVIYVDMQSPESAAFFTDQLPGIIDKHVRSGEVVLQLRAIALEGEESKLAQQGAIAAQLQNRLWEFSDIFFANQGEPDSGYVTEEFLADVWEAAEVDVALAETAPGSNIEKSALGDNDRTAELLGVKAVPDFYLYALGVDKPVRIVPEQPTAEAFTAALEAARAGS